MLNLKVQDHCAYHLDYKILALPVHWYLWTNPASILEFSAFASAPRQFVCGGSGCELSGCACIIVSTTDAAWRMRVQRKSLKIETMETPWELMTMYQPFHCQHSKKMGCFRWACAVDINKDLQHVAIFFFKNEASWIWEALGSHISVSIAKVLEKAGPLLQPTTRNQMSCFSFNFVFSFHVVHRIKKYRLELATICTLEHYLFPINTAKNKDAPKCRVGTTRFPENSFQSNTKLATALQPVATGFNGIRTPDILGVCL